MRKKHNQNDDYNFQDEEFYTLQFSQDEEESGFDLNSYATRKSAGGKKGRGGHGRKKKRTPLQRVTRVLLSVFLVLVITGCLTVGTFAVYVFGFVDGTLDDNLDELKLNYTTTIYVKNSETGQYEEYQRLHGEENRIWVSINELPEDLAYAYIAIEDKRFLSHNGVDWKRTVSAFANLFLDFFPSKQGGSTITQQLVKNLTGDNDTDAMRKIREIMRARYVEDNYTKETIMECYLNTIAMGNGLYGAETASEYYFGKSASDLSLCECAALAAMAKEPEKYRPDKNPENNKTRRNTVLFEMYDQGYISKDEYEEAIAQELIITANKADLGEAEVNNWFVDTVIDNVINDLMEQYGYDRDYASKRFYNAGFKIYCTMDPQIQATLEAAYADARNFTAASNSKNPSEMVQSAMTIMDYQGHIVAIVGGRGEKTANRSLNRAYNVARQPGSSIKPIGVYAPALEANLITYSSIEQDEPIQTVIDGKTTSWPKNSYSGYRGATTIASALERSVNTVAVRTLQKLTLKNSFDFLTNKVGITTLDEENDLVLGSLALGGCYNGITPTQMTAAYAIFGNGGKYYQPSTYVKITDQYDAVVLEQPSATVAIGEDTAFIMNKMLQNVIYGSSGTGTAAKFDNIPMFGKTGTTSDNYDRWFVGGTGYYVAACWYGFDTPASLKGVSGNPALNTWKTVMKQVHADLDAQDFVQPDSVVYARYCTSSGMPATNRCSSLANGWYKVSYLPACTTHGGTLLDTVSAPSGVSGGTSRYASSASSAISSVASVESAPEVSSETASEPETASSEPAEVSEPESSSSQGEASTSSELEESADPEPEE